MLHQKKFHNVSLLTKKHKGECRSHWRVAPTILDSLCTYMISLKTKLYGSEDVFLIFPQTLLIFSKKPSQILPISKLNFFKKKTSNTHTFLFITISLLEFLKANRAFFDPWICWDFLEGLKRQFCFNRLLQIIDCR